MGFHIYTDGWWRNPKNAVTTEATIVEIRKTNRFGGNEFKSAGYYQSVVVDVNDPETGQAVRTDNSEVYSGLQPFQVGQSIKVRWSAKRKYFELYSWNTAPEGDAGAGVQGLAGGLTGGVTPVSGSELSPDQAARVQSVLGALGVSGASRVEVVNAQQNADGQPDHISQLERLAALRKSGALTDAEFEQQKRQLLGES
jgi:Short C-terminal domain